LHSLQDNLAGKFLTLSTL